jgi:TonB family protein
MATRAFLLCGDEKAVHAVTQILDELEVSFEHSSEPPFALKRLAAQRFDLLIVDCDNAQNATQVFNSARASNLNKNSIAIAIVEGKAGVPNAFRLGASLVLTKPVSLEQTRNTLRTGMGMSRKDEVKPANIAPVAPSAPSPAPAAPVQVTPTPAVLAPAPVSVALPVVVPVAPAPPVPAPLAKAPAVLAPVAPAPTVPPPALAESITKPAAPAIPVAEKPVMVARPPSIAVPPATERKLAPEAKPTVGVAAFAKAAAAAAGAAPGTSKFDSVFSSAPIPAPPAAHDESKAKASTEKTSTQKVAAAADGGPVLRIEDPLADDDNALDPLRDHGVPSFGAMGKQPFAGYEEPKRSSGKGGLIAALVLLLLGAGAGAAWITQPAFRALVEWEYRNAKVKIATLRGQTPQVEASATPEPAPIPPAAVQPAPMTTPAGTLSSDPNSLQNGAASSTNAANPTSSETISLAIPPAGATPAQAASTAAGSLVQKGAAVQNAKQDTTPGHAASNPALVAASLPPITAAKPASELLEIPEDFADDQIVRRVHPVYPKQAKLKKVQGTVVLQAIVDKQGKVDSLQLVSGDPSLAQAAADAVKQWRYKPYSHNGEPADFQTRVTVDFKLP